jgi:molybdopterin/thiamine biosynthesis adenylyltransferase
MSLGYRQENAKTLAALLGIEEEEAAQRLFLRIAVTFDAKIEAIRELASHIIEMLSRTVEYAGLPDDEPFAVEVVIGDSKPITAAPLKVYAGEEGGDFIVRETAPLAKCNLLIPRPLLVIAACYVSAAAVRIALGPTFPYKNSGPIVLSWAKLFGDNLELLSQPLDIGEVYLAGAGAVGHGFIYTLRHHDVSGTLYVTDPKKATAGGLNRCLLFDDDDLGHPKATRVCEVASPLFPKLKLVPVDKELDDARKLRGKDFLIQKLVVGVDSRRVRRSLQAALPGTVFDASTTDITEVVLHFSRQPTELACLSCVYPENERERKHEENVAEALGISIEQVRAGYISAPVATKICAKYTDLQPDDLIGRAFDTVYKELCGVGKLKTVGGHQVLAPFSFVSVLAGAYLAVEFAIRVAARNEGRFNYWRVSPWNNPVTELRQLRPRDPNCEFCSNPVMRRVVQQMWSGNALKAG